MRTNTLLPLGTIKLGRSDYTTANVNFTGSTMVLSSTTITITLGTPSGTVTTAAGAGSMSWTPSATATDLAATRVPRPRSTSRVLRTSTSDRRGPEDRATAEQAFDLRKSPVRDV